MPSIRVDGTACGGFRDDGVAYPVSVSILEPPPVSCPLGITLPSASGSDTWDVCATAFHYQQSSSQDLGTRQCNPCDPPETMGSPATVRITQNDAEEEIGAASVSAGPALPKRVHKLPRGAQPGNYGALIYRGGIPFAKRIATSTCCELLHQNCQPPQEEECSPEDTILIEDIVFGGSAEQWRGVGDDEHAIEDLFAVPSLAPYSLSASHIKRRTFDIVTIIEGSCELPGIPGTGAGPSLPDCCFDEEQFVQIRTAASAWPSIQQRQGAGGQPSMLAFFDSTHPGAGHVTRAVNYIFNPHWQYYYWFPPDSDVDFWKVAGTKINSTDYWLKIREQHMDLDEMPSFERTLKRNSMQSAPLLEGGLASLIGTAILPEKSSWWGVSRFDVDEPVPDPSKALDSSSSSDWSFVDCTAVFGAGGITLTPTGGSSTIIAEYDPGFVNDPRLYMHIAKKITVGWNPANVSSVSVLLVSQSGDTIQLATTPGSYDRPFKADAGYAGSWGRDFDAGSSVTDFGTDVQSGGLSAASMSDAERVHHLSLLTGFGAKKLRFEITVVNMGQTVSIDYPVFAVGSAPQLIAETGQTSDYYVEDGPGWRAGDWNSYDLSGDAFVIPPNVRAFGGKWSVLDWLAYRRLVFDGVAETNGLDTELAALYDAVEGQTRKKVHEHTLAFAVPAAGYGRALLVNSWREVPPLALMPRRELDEDFAPVTPTKWVQDVYAYDQLTRFIVNASGFLHQFTDDGAEQITTQDLSATIPGWFATKHERAVTNAEGDDYLLKKEGINAEFAKASPWHGYFAMVGKEAAGVSHPSYDVSGSHVHARAYLRGQVVVVGIADNLLPKAWADVETVLTANAVCIRFERREARSRLWLILGKVGGGIGLRYSEDNGRTWSAEVASIAAGKWPSLVVADSGIKYLYWRDGTAIKGQIMDAQNNVIAGPFTAIASGVDDSGIAADEMVLRGGEHRIGLLYTASGSLQYVTSIDGQTFS